MKKIKLPNLWILIFAGLGAFWIANIIHPGFNPVGVMVLLLIPVFIFELLYPQPDLESIIEQAPPTAVTMPSVPRKPVNNTSSAENLKNQ